MDDDNDHDKTLIEKTLQTVKDIASTVSDAAKHAMEPDPVKPGEQPVAFVPMAGDGFADPMMMPVYAPTKQRTKKAARPRHIRIADTMVDFRCPCNSAKMTVTQWRAY